MIRKDGTKVKTIMRSFELGEISAVDRPAQKGATVAIMKRDDDEMEKVMASMALTTMAGGHSHLITMGGGEYVRRAGMTDYTDDHAHPWVMDENGQITVGHAMGHNHGIEVLTKGEMTVAALKNRLSKEGEPATSEDGQQAGNDTAAEAIGNHEDHDMTPEEKKAAEAAAAAQKAELEKMTKRAERAESIANMSDAHRSFYKGLKAEDQEAFLALTDAERDAQITKAQEANTVVYKAKDGTEYRKSDDPRLVAMAKSMDEERAKREAAEATAKQADLEKRAGDLTHIPGDLATRVALLKGIDALPAEDREKALTALKAQNEKLGKSFERVGTSAVPADDTLDPLDAMATDIAKRDGLTFEQAYNKALNTPEGQALYNAHIAKRQGATA